MVDNFSVVVKNAFNRQGWVGQVQAEAGRQELSLGFPQESGGSQVLEP